MTRLLDNIHCPNKNNKIKALIGLPLSHISKFFSGTSNTCRIDIVGVDERD